MNKLKLFFIVSIIFSSLYCYTSFIDKVIGCYDKCLITQTEIPVKNIDPYKSMRILIDYSAKDTTQKQIIFQLMNKNEEFTMSYEENAVEFKKETKSGENYSFVCKGTEKYSQFEIAARQNGADLTFECNKSYIGTFDHVSNVGNYLIFPSIKSNNDVKINSFSITYFKMNRHYLTSVFTTFILFLLFVSGLIFSARKYIIKYSGSFIISVSLLLFFTAWYAACTYLSTHDNQFHDIFIQPEYIFSDFTDYIDQMKYLFGKGFFEHEGRVPFILNSGGISIYIFFMYLLKGISGSAVYLFITVTFLAILTLVVYSIRDIAASSFFSFISILFLTLLSFPVLMTLQRGNMEGLVFSAIFLAILLHLNSRNYTSAALIGFAASVKIFPIIFIFIFLYKKLWKEALSVVLSAAAISAVCIYCIDYNLIASAEKIVKSMAWYNADYNMKILSPSEMRFYHSYFAVLKDTISIFAHKPYNDYTAVYKYYLMFSAVLMPVLLIRGYFLRQSSQLVLLCVMMLLFAPMSADYRLLYILIPSIIVFKYMVNNKVSAKFVLSFILPVLMILFPTSQLNFNDVPLNPFIKNFALNILLLAVVVFNDFPDINHIRGNDELV